MGSPRTFELDLPPGISVEDGLADARRRGAEVGIVLEGDGASGTFRGAAEGRYRVQGRRLLLEVDKKPMLVTWSMIEKGLQRLFR